MLGNVSWPGDPGRMPNSARGATGAIPAGPPHCAFTTQRAQWAVAAAVAFAFLSAPAALPMSAAAIQFGNVTFQTSFPSGISLHARVQSQASPIVAAWFECQVPGELEPHGVDIPVTPASQLELTYTWDPRLQRLPPGAIVTCHWEVSDAIGNLASSASVAVDYEDTRFNWQRLRDGGTEVWWHDAPASLGAEALAIARQAAARQQPFYQASQPVSARIMLYNSHAEISAWEPDLPPFVAAQAFPAAGVAVVATQPSAIEEAWLRAAISHEISRLYFYRTAANPASPTPEWLAEGLALYQEGGDHADEQRLLQAAVLGHQLLPLSALTGDFGNDRTHVAVGDAEAWSAATYLVQQYGANRVLALLRAYRSGQATPQAFASAIGKAPGAFEDDWLAWIGVPLAWRAKPGTPAAAAPTRPAPLDGAAPSDGGTARSQKDAVAAPGAPPPSPEPVRGAAAQVEAVSPSTGLTLTQPGAGLADAGRAEAGRGALGRFEQAAIALLGLALLLAVAAALLPRLSAFARRHEDGLYEPPGKGPK
jgi:hypothetical protein